MIIVVERTAESVLSSSWPVRCGHAQFSKMNLRRNAGPTDAPLFASWNLDRYPLGFKYAHDDNGPEEDTVTLLA